MTNTENQTGVSLLTTPNTLRQANSPKNILPRGYFETIKEAIEVLKIKCPTGAILVLIDFPIDRVKNELDALKNNHTLGRSPWAIKNANGEIISHDDKSFKNCEGVIVRGYVPLSGGMPREKAWQNTLIRKSENKPIFILTDSWPDSKIFSHEMKFSRGIFTRGAEVMALKFDHELGAIQIGHGALVQEEKKGPLKYTFSPLV